MIIIIDITITKIATIKINHNPDYESNDNENNPIFHKNDDNMDNDDNY